MTVKVTVPLRSAVVFAPSLFSIWMSPSLLSQKQRHEKLVQGLLLPGRDSTQLPTAPRAPGPGAGPPSRSTAGSEGPPRCQKVSPPPSRQTTCKSSGRDAPGRRMRRAIIKTCPLHFVLRVRSEVASFKVRQRHFHWLQFLKVAYPKLKRNSL